MKLAHKILIGVFATIGVVSTGQMIATPAFALPVQEKEDKEAPKAMTVPAAKITPVQAMKAAEAKSGGKAKMAMFEFDEGHWVYGVIIVKNHKLMEVELDPITGKVGDMESVTPEGEGKEFQQELAKLIK